MTDQETPTEANEILANATPEQVKWVLKRLGSRSDAEAAKKTKVHPSTVSKWPNKAELDQAVNLLLRTPVLAALEILEDAAVDAADVLVDELTKKSKLAAANSILDRIGLKGTQRVEHTGEGEDGEILVKVVGNIDPSKL